MEFSNDFPSFFSISRDYQPSFFVPFTTKFFESMSIGPFTYRQHLLFITQFFDDQATNEQGI